MKLPFLFWVFFCIGSNYSYSQNKKNIPIPILKENATIDTLIDKVFDPRTNPGKNIGKNDLKDGFLIIDIGKDRNNDVKFFVELNNKHQTNVFVNAMAYTKRNFGYFTYKKFKIFAWSDNLLYNFCSKTSQVKSFAFIYKMSFERVKHSKHLVPAFIEIYKYKNGKISHSIPPVVHH